MKLTYELHTHAQCPVDGATIGYGVKIQTTLEWHDKPIMAEEIRELVDKACAEPTLQETLTGAIAVLLMKAHPSNPFTVTTFGSHSGVTITCEA